EHGLPADRRTEAGSREPAAPRQKADPADRQQHQDLRVQRSDPDRSRRKVICGHGRLLACRGLGWTAVPTLALDHLTPAQACAFMIADNRLSEIATWDDRLLAQQLKDLSLLGLDFSLEILGFEMGEIDLRIAA